MPFISIILPTHNSGSTLKIALDSIISQTFRDFELIIIDGLSSDNTSQVAGSFTIVDNRIKFISEADEGIYDAMNKGIRQSAGQWIYFIGSDDSLYNAEVLQKVHDNIDTGQKGMVFYGNVVISGDTNWACDGDVYDGVFDLNKLMKKNICHQSVFYNTDFLKREIGAFNTKYTICADWDFNLKCWSKTRFIFMDLIVADFNAGGESTKSREDEDFTEDFLPNILSYFNISPFNAMVNTTQFPQYGKLLNMQKKLSYPHYILDRIKKKMINHQGFF
jgi:glycosyltransferase involved in cell wall biosynthesis